MRENHRSLVLRRPFMVTIDAPSSIIFEKRLINIVLFYALRTLVAKGRACNGGRMPNFGDFRVKKTPPRAREGNWAGELLRYDTRDAATRAGEKCLREPPGAAQGGRRRAPGRNKFVDGIEQAKKGAVARGEDRMVADEARRDADRHARGRGIGEQSNASRAFDCCARKKESAGGGTARSESRAELPLKRNAPRGDASKRGPWERLTWGIRHPWSALPGSTASESPRTSRSARGAHA